MRRLIMLLLLTLAPLLVAGCGSDGGTDPGASVVGTYALTSIDGSPLPFSFIDGEFKVVVVRDELTLAPGDIFTRRAVFTVTEGGVTTTQEEVVSGRYAVAGSTITFRLAEGDPTTNGTVSGRSITIVSDGSTLIYVRQ